MKFKFAFNANHLAEPSIPPATEDESAETVEGLSFITASEGVWAPDSLAFFGKESRSLIIAGEITHTLANGIVSQLLELSSEDDKAPIRVYINTEGGSVIDGLAIYDTMRIIPNPVFTLALGQCSSMGMILLQGGDFREAFPSTTFFHHEIIQMQPVTSLREAEDGMKIYQHLLNTCVDIMKKRSKISKTLWNKHFAGVTSFHFTAHEALEYKMIDNIVCYAGKKPLKMDSI